LYITKNNQSNFMFVLKDTRYKTDKLTSRALFLFCILYSPPVVLPLLLLTICDIKTDVLSGKYPRGMAGMDGMDLCVI